MEKVRVHQIAKEAGYTSKEIIEKATQMGLEIKSASNAVSLKVAQAIYTYIQTGEIIALSDEDLGKKKPKAAKKTTSKSTKAVPKAAKKADKSSDETKDESTDKKPPKETAKKSTKASNTQKAKLDEEAISAKKPKDIKEEKAVKDTKEVLEKVQAKPVQEDVKEEASLKTKEESKIKEEASLKVKEEKQDLLKEKPTQAKQEKKLTIVKKARPSQESTLEASPKEAVQREGKLGVATKIAAQFMSSKDAKSLAQENVQEAKKPQEILPKSEEKEEEKQALANKAQDDDEPRVLKPIQRRGLVIVKKRRDKIPPKRASYARTEKISLSMMFSNAEESLKRKKKEKKNSHSKRAHTTKMDLLGNSDFADISLDDENVVIMPDFSVQDKVEQTPPPAPKNRQPRQPFVGNRLGNFHEGGIQRRSRKKSPKRHHVKSDEVITKVEIPKEIRLYELADKMGKNPSELISKLFMLGLMTTKNDFLDEDAIEILASEFNIEVSIVDEAKEFDYLEEYDEGAQNSDAICEKAPVVTIMGHVDHGKTSLLDFIRNSRVATSEAGGITQHVGAYMVEKNGKKITFIDTPGHEAFSAMRARGASITDIVIIVVAADDGVKPQTKEAVAHAKAAGVPIIIAVNKMDKENANPDLVKTGLSELDIMPTDWGGQYEFVPISAKTGQGIDELLEIVLLQADVLELKANPSALAKATIVESSLQKSRGPVATLIMENGTLKPGDTVVAGAAYGKVRALQDDQGSALKSIGPGECGTIIGLSAVAGAGETLIAMKSDKEARAYAKKRYDHDRAKELSKSTKVSIEELGAKIKEGRLKTLPIILKADVQGSLEAIKASLEKLQNDEIKVNIVHLAVGGITQSDIELASSNPHFLVIGFNIRPTGGIKERAKERGVQIKTYSVIYELIDDVKALLGGMMSPVISEEQLGQAQIRQVINIPKLGQIAGCMVSEGVINRGAHIRLIRDGVVIYEGTVSSLKRFKDDVREVAKGFECGVGIEGCDNMQEGDYIESFQKKETAATLD